MGASLGRKQSKMLNREDSILNCEDNLCDFLAVTRRCYERQTNVVSTLRNLANELDKIDRDIRKAEIGLSVAGGTLAVAGIGLSFVTFGASTLILTIAGLSLAAGAAGIAASIAEKIIKSQKMKEANEAVLSYSQAVLEYAPILQLFCDGLSTDEERERLHDVLTDASISSDSVRFRGVKSQKDLCEACAKGHRIVSTSFRVEEALGMKGSEGGMSRKPAGQVAKFSLNMITDVSTFTDKAFKTLSPLAQGIKIGSHVLTGVGLILDIGTIVYYSLKLHQRKPSEVAELLRKIAGAFEQ